MKGTVSGVYTYMFKQEESNKKKKKTYVQIHKLVKLSYFKAVIYTSQDRVSWEHSLAGEIVSDDVSLIFVKNTYLAISLLCI